MAAGAGEHERADPSIGDSRPAALVLNGVSKYFNEVCALESVDLQISQGEFVTLLGPSGCGKTTLLRIVAGLDRLDTGVVEISGHTSTSTPPEQRPVNYVFQHYALFPHLDVADNIRFGLKVARTPREEAAERVGTAISMVQLEGLEARRVDQLSGGQQQRVALARAIVNRPDILLLDEPLGALDLKLRKEMQLELRALHRRLGGTFIYVTHDQEEALVMSNRVVIMRSGRIVQDGTPQAIYRNPRNRFVAEFIGETNLLAAQATETAIIVRNLDLRIPNESNATGDVSLSIRPEHLRLDDGAGTTEGGRLSVGGELLDSIFLGSLYRHLVRLGDGTILTVQELATDDRDHAIGSRVVVSWSPSDTAILPG
ncbi:MAG: ABC transporter ATP-binding protein [bacterium]|nr:ABC transporter ATP-binding protein [bacterium]